MRLSIFLLAFGLLVLELFATSILALVISPEAAIYSIAAAMLGLGVAATIVCLIPDAPLKKHELWCTAGCMALIGPAILAMLFYCQLLKLGYNADIVAVLPRGFDGIQNLAEAKELALSLQAGAVLCLVYFLHGIALSSFFRLNLSRTSTLYAFDLFGAALGCLAYVWVIEFFGFGVTATTAVLAPVLAGAVYAAGRGSQSLARGIALFAVFLGVTMNLPGIASHLEPQPQLQLSARDFHQNKEVRELDYAWTSYGRIAALEILQPGAEKPRIIMSQREGDSHAVTPDEDAVSLSFPPQVLPEDAPENILVLFAGAGRDMLELRQLYPEAAITGVELVPQMFTWPIKHMPLRMEPVLTDPNMALVEAEGREFISRAKEAYDLILLSYSGAGASYYTGAAAHSAGFLYTLEAFQRYLELLTPNGELVVLNGQKGRFIRTLKKIWPGLNDDISPIEEAILVVTDHGSDSYKQQIGSGWDSSILLVKPSGFQTASEVARRTQDLTAHYQPFATKQLPYGIFFRDEALALFEQSIGASYAPVRDDYPYFLKFSRPLSVFERAFWENEPALLSSRRLKSKIQLFGWFVAAAFLGAVAPVLIAQRGRIQQRHSWNHLVYFLCLGAGFMLVEIGLLNKLQLIVGHPGYTLAVVLTSAILFAGLGSFASDRNFDRGRLNFRTCALLACLSGALLLFAINQFSAELMALPRPVKLIGAGLAQAIPFFLMGHLFPQGLRAAQADSHQLVAWAFALNGVASAAGSGLAIIFALIFGFNITVIVGLGIYLVVAFLPHKHRQSLITPNAA